MPTPLTDDTETLRFRGPTIEAALDAAEKSLGGRVKLLAANRLRRGGIGGFFASDMGVEVTVSPESETIEEALQRLVEGTAAEEREEWRRQVASSAATAAPAGLAERPRTEAPAPPQPRPAPPRPFAQHLRDEGPEFIEFLPSDVPTLRRAAQAAQAAMAGESQPELARVPISPTVIPTVEIVPEVVAPAEVIAAPRSAALHPAPAKPSAAMLRRHVELAVSAADQLIESLTHTRNVKSITARVIVRSGNHYEVETETRWESHAEGQS